MLFRVFTIIAVVALGISTWILTGPARHAERQPNARPTDLPGYYLKNAVLTDFDIAGNPSVRIEAERIDQIAHGNEVALYNVRVNYQAPSGENWVMVGDVAHVQPGGKVIDVSGNVRLQGEAGAAGRETPAVMHTDTLRYQGRRPYRFRGPHPHGARSGRKFERAHAALRIEGQWPLPPLKSSCWPR